MTDHEPGAYRHGPPYTPRQLHAVTRDALAAYAETASRGPAGAVALAALADLNREARPDLREPYVSRWQVQPGLWLTVDASHNIMLEARTADEAELLAAYALGDVRAFADQLASCRSVQRIASEDGPEVARTVARDWAG